MTKKLGADRVTAALTRNMVAYNEGRVIHEPKTYDKKSITDRLYRASKLGTLREARKNGKA